jgi:hypothetical protein
MASPHLYKQTGHGQLPIVVFRGHFSEVALQNHGICYYNTAQVATVAVAVVVSAAPEARSLKSAVHERTRR